MKVEQILANLTKVAIILVVYFRIQNTKLPEFRTNLTERIFFPPRIVFQLWSDLFRIFLQEKLKNRAFLGDSEFFETFKSFTLAPRSSLDFHSGKREQEQSCLSKG